MKILLVLILWLQTMLATAAELSPDVSMDVNGLVQYLEDPQGQLTIDDIRGQDQQWTQNGTKTFNQGYSSSAWWLHLSLQNDSSDDVFRYLEVGYAVLDYVDAYVVSDGELVATYHMGDKLPFAERPVEHRFFVIPLQWSAGQSLDIYYRVKTSTSVQAPLVLRERNSFEQRENTANIAQGLYYGAMLVIAVYNLLIFIVVWERSYLFYVMFVMAMPLFIASISGQAYHFLWPASVVWNDHSIPFFLSMAFGSSALFARRFLQVREWSRSLNLGLISISVLAFTCLLVSFFIPYKYSIHFLVPLGLFACVFEMVVGGLSWYKGVPNARYYVIAWLSFLSGGVLLALSKLGALPANFVTEYAIQIGSVLEAVLLSFALAERINVERRLRYAAQEEALIVTRRLNEELEERVRERTQELERLNARLEEMSNTDQLTKVKNRRYLETVMREEWARCMRYKHQFAVIMLDVDFFKKVNDQYGHPAGDSCLIQVAERIGTCVRWPSDRLARYGGEEFCLILPETGEEGARVVAERIRDVVSATPIETDDANFTVTVSIGVCVGVPSTGSAEDMVKSADLALYQSKENGRDQVTLYRQENLDNISHLQVRKTKND